MTIRAYLALLGPLVVATAFPLACIAPTESAASANQAITPDPTDPCTVPATLDLVTGTWARKDLQGEAEVTETLVLNPDLTYTLTNVARCAPLHRCFWLGVHFSTSGTYALRTDGLDLTPTIPNPLATAFTLESGPCLFDAGGLVLTAHEPSPNGPTIVLSKQ